MLDARESPAGELEVVLAPGDSGILLHEAVGHGLEADFNRKGTSNYTDQIGQQGRERAVHRGRRRHARPARAARINVDDEGNEPERSGADRARHPRGYMHDRHSARASSRPTPTGNGRRESFKSHPMPRMTNTLLLAGPHDPDEIVRSVKRGIYAQQVRRRSGRHLATATSCSRSPRAT